MKYIFLILFILNSNCLVQTPVKVAGEMKRIMQQGDLSASILIDTLSTTSHLYGLGAAAELEGEIIIVNGKTYQTSLENGKIVTRQSGKIAAALLVYAEVERWKKYTIRDSVFNIQMLEKVIENVASENGIKQPFPFLLKIPKGKMAYHIIDWKKGVPHTMTTHKQFAKSGLIEDEEMLVLGFYSSQHHGVFTHHSSNLHAHVLNKDHSLVGHVDNVEITSEFELSLPFK